MARLVVSLVLFSTIVATVFAEDSTPTVEEAVRRHEANWAAIRTIRMDYETTSDFGLGPASSYNATLPGRWIVDGERERLTSRSRDEQGRVAREDWLADGEGVRRMRTLEHAQSASIHRIVRGSSGGDRSELFTFQPQTLRRIFYLTDAPMTVGELVAMGRVVASDGGATSEGDRLTRLRVTLPNPGGEDRRGGVADIYLNRDKGYLVHRVDALVPDMGVKAGDPTCPVDMVYTHEATSYREVGEGIWIAEGTLYSVYDPSVPNDQATPRVPVCTIRWRATDLRVNEPIEESEFRSVFPEGAVVSDDRDGESRLRVCDASGDPTEDYVPPPVPTTREVVRTLFSQAGRALGGLLP